MKIFKKLAIKIFAPVLTILIAFVGIGFLFDAKIETDRIDVEKTTQKAQTNWDNAKSDYVPGKESAFYAAYNNLSSTEYSEPNENGEYDLAKLGSVVINLTEANKSALASIGLKEDAVDTKANATLSATLEHGKMNIVVSCQYGNRYLEASTDAEAILLEHFTGGAPVKLSGTKIQTNTNINRLAAVTLHDAKIAEVSAGTITFSNSTYGSGSSDTAGRGLYISGGTVGLNNVGILRYKISNGGSGGGIWLAGGTLNISGSSTDIYNCAGSKGGGIYAQAGTLNFNGGTISECLASAHGGGIFSESAATLNIAANVLGNSTAGNGGGIYSDGTTSIKDGAVINGNSAPQGDGGGVFAQNSEDKESRNFSMDGGIIGDTELTDPTPEMYGNLAVNGGGLYIHEISFSFIDRDYPQIVGNCATDCGGGLYIYSDFYTGTFRELTVNYNYAVNGGGGVYIGAYTSSSLMIDGCIFSDNTADHGPGGGIYVDDVTTLRIISTDIIGNNSAGYGGGIYNRKYSKGSSITLEYAYIHDNYAGAGEGGGVYCYNVELTINTGTEINENVADIGGGVYFSNDTGDFYTFAMTGGTIGSSSGSSYATSTSCGNSADNGGGVYLGGSTNFNMYPTSTASTAATPQIRYNYAVNGGGIYCGSPSVYISLGHCEIRYNGASSGGGLYLNACAGLSGGGASGYSEYYVRNNKATSNGGGIYVNNISLTISYLYISNNEATGNGGGIYATGSSSVKTLTINSNCYVGATSASSRATSSAYSNKASSGGGIYANNYISLTVNGRVNYNYATSSGGGGISFEGSGSRTFTVGSSAYINYNYVTGSGGGIYYTATSSTFSMVGGYIQSNNASSYGGGIYHNGGNFSITGGTIGTTTAITNVSNAATNLTNSSNYATWGGGIYVGATGAGVTIKGATLRYNYATYGGGMYMDNGTTVTLSATVNGNGAQAGAGIYQYGTLNLTYDDSGSSTIYPIVTYNKASGGGGGVYSNSGTLNFNGSGTGGQISYNQANIGGGIKAYDSNVNLLGGQIRANNAVNNSNGGKGGGIHFETSSAAKTLSMNNSSNTYIGGTSYSATGRSDSSYSTSYDGNRAEFYGGGVYIKGVSGKIATMNLNFGYVASNVAGSYGGGIYIDQYATVNVGENASSANNAQYISANYAGNSGGGVYITGTSAKFYMASGYLGRTTSTLATTTSYSNRSPNGAGLYVASSSPYIYIHSRSSSYYAQIYGNYSTSHGGGIYGASGADLYLYGYASIQYNKAGAASDVYGSGIYYTSGTAIKLGGYVKIRNNYNYSEVCKKGELYLASSSSYMNYNSTAGTLYASADVYVYKYDGTYGSAGSSTYIYYSSDSTSRTNASTAIKAYVGSYPTPMTLAVSGSYVYMSAKPAYYTVTLRPTPNTTFGTCAKSQTYTPSGAGLSDYDFWQSTGLSMDNNNWLWNVAAAGDATVSVYTGTTFTTSGRAITFTYKGIVYAVGEATAKSGYTFDGWSVTSGTITAARTINAIFVESGYIILSYDIGGLGGNHLANVGEFVRKTEKQLWLDEKQRILGTNHPWLVSVDDNTDTDKLAV